MEEGALVGLLPVARLFDLETHTLHFKMETGEVGALKTARALRWSSDPG